MIVTIKVSNEEKTLKYKHMMVGADIRASRDDPTLFRLVEEAVKNFNGTVDDVQVILSMTW